MKKSLLALAVLGAFAVTAQAQSSVTIYGIVDTGVFFQSKSGANNNGLLSMETGVMSGSRVGFKGTEELGGGLKANFQLETGFAADTGGLNGQENGINSLFRRTSTVGLSGDFGSVNVGRQTDFSYTHTAAYSSAGYLGNFSSYNGTTQARLQGSRTDNSIRYDLPNYMGITGGVMFGLGEQAAAGTAGQSFGAALKYDNGPISFGGSYYMSRYGKTPSDATLNPVLPTTGNPTPTLAAAYGNTAVKTFTLGGSYAFSSSKAYASWSQVKMGVVAGSIATTVNPGFAPASAPTAGTSANDKLNIYEIGYNYDLTASLKLLSAFTQTRANFTTGVAQGKINQLMFGTDYFLSKRTDVYALATYMKSAGVTNPLSLHTAVADGTTGGVYGIGVGLRHAF